MYHTRHSMPIPHVIQFLSVFFEDTDEVVKLSIDKVKLSVDEFNKTKQMIGGKLDGETIS